MTEAGGANRAGNVPTNVPEQTAGVWATYRFTAMPLTLSAGCVARDDHCEQANTIRISGYALLDAQASWRFGPGDITLRGKNLTNQFYVDWGLTRTRCSSARRA